MSDNAERAKMWVKYALQRHEDGDMDDAECGAYEAGRYGIAMPEAIAENEFLKHSFERGAADAPRDAAGQERADAVAEAGLDPSVSVGNRVAPGAIPGNDEITFVIWHNGDSSVGIAGEQATATVNVGGFAAAEDRSIFIEDARDALRKAFSGLWDFGATVATKQEFDAQEQCFAEPSDCSL